MLNSFRDTSARFESSVGEKVMSHSEATRSNVETASGTDGRLAPLETDMAWVKRLLCFLVALVIGIYLDLPAVVQGLLPQ